MKSLRKPLLIGLTVLGLGSGLAAQAQTTPPAEGRHAHAANKEQMQAKMAEHWAARQAKLHDALKLTAAQETAWTAYQNAIKPTAPAMGERASWAGLSAPARMEKMIAMAKQHITVMESHLSALNTFYSVLSADQKKIFDDNTRGGMDWHMRHGPQQH